MSTETEPQAKTLAERMYGPQEPAAPAAPAATPAAPAAAPTEAEKATTAEQAADDGPDLAERMYGDSGALDSPEQYDAKLGGVFDALEYAARYAENEEETQALAEGRKESAALLHEMQASRDEAHAISTELGEWNQKYMAGVELSEDAAASMREWTESTLKAEWGDQYEAKVGHAKRAAEAAMERLPWLRDLLESDAGNSEKLVRHFANIGERNARRAARAKR